MLLWILGATYAQRLSKYQRDLLLVCVSDLIPTVLA
jgi:hypothetical protein